MKPPSKLNLLRRNIDKIDKKILILLKARLETSAKIQMIKKANHFKIIQKERERAILLKLQKQARKLRLPFPFIRSLYRVIFRISRTRRF